MLCMHLSLDECKLLTDALRIAADAIQERKQSQHAHDDLDNVSDIVEDRMLGIIEDLAEECSIMAREIIEYTNIRKTMPEK